MIETVLLCFLVVSVSFICGALYGASAEEARWMRVLDRPAFIEKGHRRIVLRSLRLSDPPEVVIRKLKTLNRVLRDGKQ